MSGHIDYFDLSSKNKCSFLLTVSGHEALH